MSMVAVTARMSASTKCTLCAVLAVTISLGPAGRLLRSCIPPVNRPWGGPSIAGRRDHPRRIIVFVDLARFLVAETPEVDLGRRHLPAGPLVAPCHGAAHHDDIALRDEFADREMDHLPILGDTGEIGAERLAIGVLGQKGHFRRDSPGERAELDVVVHDVHPMLRAAAAALAPGRVGVPQGFDVAFGVHDVLPYSRHDSTREICNEDRRVSFNVRLAAAATYHPHAM